jgi:hypothetical protein
MINKKMNLAQIKNSNISIRRMFHIERAIVREITDLWCKEKSYFSDDFKEDVELSFKGQRIEVSFTNKGRMRHGAPEATVNDMMKGLILTMATDQATGNLLKIHEAVIGNILDVFVHRLKEIADRKFIFQRLQTLALGFGIAFGLDKKFYPIKKARPFLEEALTVASLSTAVEMVASLIHDMHAVETLAPKEIGVTFHIFMAKENEASFISLPFEIEQANYVSLLGTHTLRCNILAEPDAYNTIKSGILKIDAPSNPLNFVRHKGIALSIEEKGLMAKLRSTGIVLKKDFSEDEIYFLKLLFNEYVQLAYFLLSSKMIDSGLRLLIIFPRINIFKILHQENSSISTEEPQTLGELASLKGMVFPIPRSHLRRKGEELHRIPERYIQEKVFEVIRALARNTLKNLYKPLTDIKRSLIYYSQKEYSDMNILINIKHRVDEMSAYLKKLNRIQRVVLTENGKEIDLDASICDSSKEEASDDPEEIIKNIQAAEVEQSREVVVSKMLQYLSFVTVKLEQLERVSSSFIKQEIIKELNSYTLNIIIQAKSFYKLVMGKTERRKH